MKREKINKDKRIRRDKRMLRASYTIELTFLMPLILFLIMGCILALFYYHDKCIIAGAAYETAVVGSTKAREVDGADQEEIESLFSQRIRGKCILFGNIQGQVSASEEQILVKASASTGKMSISSEKRMQMTIPEKKIREKRRIKELIDGTQNNN